jgi:hypothetical protein
MGIPLAEGMEGREDASILDGMCSRENNSSNSDWVKREGWVSAVCRRGEGFFSGREPMWGRQAEERSKMIPPIRILYITEFLLRSKRLREKIKRREFVKKWHSSPSFVKLKIFRALKKSLRPQRGGPQKF